MQWLRRDKAPWVNWIVDFGVDMTEGDAMLFEQPFKYVEALVKPMRSDKRWWLHERPRPAMRSALGSLERFVLTVRVSKYRLFVWQRAPAIPDTATVATARADDTTFGILHSRFHELWSLRMCTWLGVGNDPRYTPTTCFETFPFPQGLTPADTADQQIEVLEGGASIPAGILMSNVPLVTGFIEFVATKKEVIVTQRDAAIAIAIAAKRLDDLRQNWLNPPEWTTRVPEVVPLGMDVSPYPDRIVPKAGISEADAKALQKRTLTNLYNARPAWLSAAHATLDLAVASAYGWADYTADMPDQTILARLLGLNLARSGKQA